MRRQPTRFEVWAWSPIVSFQVGLTAGYLALIYFGISALISSPPSFTATTPQGWSWLWSVGLVTGSVLASLGSISRHRWFGRLETIGSSLVSLMVGSYALLLMWLAHAAGDAGMVASAAGFVALAVPLVIRTVWLYSQLLRK